MWFEDSRFACLCFFLFYERCMHSPATFVRLDPSRHGTIGDTLSRWRDPLGVRGARASLLVNTFTRVPWGAGSVVSVRLLTRSLSDEEHKQLAVCDHEAFKSTATTFLTQMGTPAVYRVRWWSCGGVEYRVCGHGNVAAGYAIYYVHKLVEATIPLTFKMDFGGDLVITTDATSQMIEQTMSTDGGTAFATEQTNVSPMLLRALGLDAGDVHYQGEWRLGTVVLTSEAHVRRLSPDFRLLEEWEARNTLVACFDGDAKGHNFMYRVFCPRLGVPEDMVTGSSMACLAQLYATMHNSNGVWLSARQASPSPGELQGLVHEGGTHIGLRGAATSVACHKDRGLRNNSPPRFPPSDRPGVLRHVSRRAVAGEV